MLARLAFWPKFEASRAFIVLPVMAGWAALASRAFDDTSETLCLSSWAGTADTVAANVEASLSRVEAANLTESAVLMALAMALPLAWPAAYSVSMQSFKSQRLSALGVFLSSFVASWIVLLLAICLGAILLRGVAQSSLPVWLAFILMLALAIAFRFSSEWKAAWRSCHRLEMLPAFGPGRLPATAGWGLRHAFHCSRLCWPTMLLPWFSSAPLAMMVGVTAISVWERRQFRSQPWRSAVMLLTLAGITEGAALVFT